VAPDTRSGRALNRAKAGQGRLPEIRFSGSRSERFRSDGPGKASLAQTGEVMRNVKLRSDPFC
jgi:hypothetical protein